MFFPWLGSLGPRASPCGRMWWQWASVPWKSSWSPDAAPVSRCCVLLPEVSQVPPLSISLGAIGMGWERQLVYLWRRFPPRNDDYQILAASSLYLHPCHWYLQQFASGTKKLSPQFLGLQNLCSLAKHSLLQDFLGPAATSGKVQGGSQAHWLCYLPSSGRY